MSNLFELLKWASNFLQRNPNLEGSKLLKKEADALNKALKKYNERASEVELSLTADYAETAAILEGDGKSLVSTDFIKEFTDKHCTKTLIFQKANKKERAALLLQAARDGRLSILKKSIDPTKKYRELYRKLLNETASAIEEKVLSMKADTFKGIVNAAGLEALRTNSGAIATSKTSKKKVIKQILHEKKSDELMDGLSSG